MRVDLAVVGGGASGLMAALWAARTAPDLHIAVLERLNRVGKKLMATGNGRCNLSNLCSDGGGYHGGALADQRALARFPADRVLNFFETIGVHGRVEQDGRVYPASDQASSVLDALRLSLAEAGAQEICDFELTHLGAERRGFVLTAADGRVVRARRVIMATGGLTAPKLGGSQRGLALLEALGHQVVPPFPALVQLKTETGPIRALKGIKVTGEAAVEIDGVERRRQSGEILFTDYGLSGPPILQLSRLAGEGLRQGRSVHISLAILPHDRQQLLDILARRRDHFPQRALENFLTGMIQKRLGQTLIKLALGGETGLLERPCRSLSDRQLASIAALIARWRLRVTGTLGFDQAQTTAGGVAGGQFDPDTMESRRLPGLYLAGELIDIDGDCGGFNLQWAWSSAMAAGEAAALSLKEAQS